MLPIYLCNLIVKINIICKQKTTNLIGMRMRVFFNHAIRLKFDRKVECYLLGNQILKSILKTSCLVQLSVHYSFWERFMDLNYLSLYIISVHILRYLYFPHIMHVDHNQVLDIANIKEGLSQNIVGFRGFERNFKTIVQIKFVQSGCQPYWRVYNFSFYQKYFNFQLTTEFRNLVIDIEFVKIFTKNINTLFSFQQFLYSERQTIKDVVNNIRF